jgi:general secretion pathway protein D
LQNLAVGLRSCRMMLPLLAVMTSGCVTPDDGTRIANVGRDPWHGGASAREDAPGRHVEASALSARPPSRSTEDKTVYFPGTGQFVGEPASHGARVAEETADGITLNLVNISVPQAAKTILSDVLAVKYTVDPGIEGKVTIQTPRPVTRSAAIDLFQSALRSNNAAIVNIGGTYRIVPADQSAVGSIRVNGRPDENERLGSRIQIVQLKYVAASEIRRILEPISPRNAIVRADDARNTISLSGNSQDIASMLDAISIFDVDVMKGMSFAMVPVKTSQPQVIAEELRGVFSSDRDGPMAGMIRFIPNAQLGAVLVISPQPEYLERAETWVRRLDARAEGTEKQFYTYLVQNRRAQELADVLQSMLSNEMAGSRGGASPRNVAPPYREASLQSSNALQQSSFQSLGNQGFGGGPSSSPASGSAWPTQTPQRPSPPPDSQPTSAISSAGDPAREPRIRIGVDEGKNAILIHATPAEYRRVMRFIGSLDVMPKQVLIEATIAEVTLTDELKFGVRWYLQNKNATSTFTDDAAGALGSIFPGFSYAAAIKNLSTTLNTLNSITDVNVISSPSLTVMDNKTAVLQIGDEVPITTQSAVSTLTAGAPIVNSVSYKDTGIILSMTPRINASGRILLDLEQEVSTVATTTSSGIDSPTIHKRQVRTSVVVNHGEALALGGLIQKSKTITKNQMPVLGDIPFLGNVFGQKDNQIVKTELIIIIIPHLMRNRNEARQVTEEFRRELAISTNGARGIDQTMRRIFE